MSTRALIVDDHPIVRATIETSLLSLNVLDAVDTADTFTQLIETLRHDDDFQLLILDLSLADVTGSDGVAYIREHYSHIPILVFSANDSADVVSQCFEHGVHGFVAKTASMQVFVSAIRIVLAGGIYIPPSAARLMGFELPEGQVVPQEAKNEQDVVRLTPKQREVFDQLMLGVPNKVIATRLDMAEGTVKAHLHSIYQLLRVSSRAQAILKSRQVQIA